VIDERGRARFWAGTSVLAPGQAAEPLPFALVPAGVGAGAELLPAPSSVPARPLFGSQGGPPVRIPLVLDASSLEPSAKDWAAFGRGAAAAGAALMVSPAQSLDRKDLLKAAGLPLGIAIAPGEIAPPDALSIASFIVVLLEGPTGIPAVLDDAALAPLVEAARSATGYRSLAALTVPPGRVPSSAALRACAEAGAVALLVAEGRGPAALPFAAQAGSASSLRASADPLGVGMCSEKVCDGAALSLCLALAPAGLVTSMPLRLALNEAAAPTADWKGVGDQLANALRVLWEDAQRTASAAGVRDPRELTRENVRALTYDAAALSGAKLAGYDERLPWWAH
jgi:hypothetical protein